MKKPVALSLVLCLPALAQTGVEALNPVQKEEMLGPVSTYRAQRASQSPIAEIISSSQARQILDAQLGDLSLSDIPYLSIVAYALWGYIAPPWANIQCFPTTTGCVDNPLYYSITAELVRGLETTQGSVFTGNEAVNLLKKQAQQEDAISCIQDLETKKAESQIKEAEYEQSYGDRSYRVRVGQTGNSVSVTPLLHGTIDPLTQAAMQRAQQARKNSETIAEQDKLYYDTLTGEGTILERSGLRNVQEVNKTRSLDDLRETVNARASFRAAKHAEEAQKQFQEQQIRKAMGSAAE